MLPYVGCFGAMAAGNYGSFRDPLGAGRLPNNTPIENLYLVGHWTQPGGGIPPVIVSAQRVARMSLTGENNDRDLAAEYFAFRSSPVPMSKVVVTS